MNEIWYKGIPARAYNSRYSNEYIVCALDENENMPLASDYRDRCAVARYDFQEYIWVDSSLLDLGYDPTHYTELPRRHIDKKKRLAFDTLRLECVKMANQRYFDLKIELCFQGGVVYRNTVNLGIGDVVTLDGLVGSIIYVEEAK